LKVSDVRVPQARLIAGAAAVIAGAAILLLTSGYNFYFDEWDFILTAPDWTWVTYLQPHNEHPVLIPRLIYAALLSTAGLRSYLPYMSVLLLLHATNVVLVFELVRRRSGDLVGLGAAALLLFLGAGWENLLWAFQMTFVGSVTCGLGALLALEQPRSRTSLGVAASLASASVMFSGIGLFFVVAAVVRLGVLEARRRDLVWFAPLVVAVAAWYVAFGRGGAATNPPPTAHNLIAAPLYLLWGLGQAAAGVVGEGGWWGPVALALAIGVMAWTWRKRRPDPFVLGVVAALVSLYLVTGLTRAQFGYEQAGAGRYVYEGAVLWLLLLGDAARDLPWRGTWRPALVACVFLAAFNSGALLVEFATAKAAQMQQEGADLQALDSARNDPCLTPGRSADPLVMPQVTSPGIYYRAVDRYGDPAPPGQVTNAAAFARARANLVRPGCKLGPVQ
jgi:hypothetical protein